MGKGHPRVARAQASRTRLYLGFQAQLVDGVLGLRILGEELVVILLQGRDSKGVTAQAPQGTPPPKGASGRLFQAHV